MRPTPSSRASCDRRIQPCYRSGAFFAERARQVPGQDPIRDILLGLVAAADEPIAGGRHKVFGSESLSVIPQTSTIGSHLPRAVGIAFAIERAARLPAPARRPPDGARGLGRGIRVPQRRGHRRGPGPGCPAVIRVASYGYQEGFGGHFHNDNAVGALRDIPGLVIASAGGPTTRRPC